MDRRSPFFILFNFPAHITVIDLELLLKPLALLLLIKNSQPLAHVLPFEQQETDQHSAEVGDVGNSGLGSTHRIHKSYSSHNQYQPAVVILVDKVSSIQRG